MKTKEEMLLERFEELKALGWSITAICMQLDYEVTLAD